MVAKITNNLEKFNYNVIIANIYETYNFLLKFIRENKDISNLEDNYKKIMTCFSPIIPHFSSECLQQLKISNDIEWPRYDSKYLENEEVNFVVQINGKKRAILNVKKNIEEKELLEIIQNEGKIEKFFKQKNINKVIFVKNKLINILVNE